MKRKNAVLIFCIFIVLLLLLVLFTVSYYKFINKKDPLNPEETISIANWNLQVFGDKKSNDTSLMNFYAEKIRHYDIIFLQEIRDKDGSSFQKLCAMLPDYECVISSRAGRSSSKEQYGIIYLKKFVISMIDLNPDELDRWERPPIRADIVYKDYKNSSLNYTSNYSLSNRFLSNHSLRNYSLRIYNIHIKPDNVSTELIALEQLIISETARDNRPRNILLLGDFNADCYYYNPYTSKIFSEWKWILDNNADTTSGDSDCAYDRIIMNNDLYNEYVNSGIDTIGITPEISDHYLVWTVIRDYDYSKKDKTFKAYIASII